MPIWEYAGNKIEVDEEGYMIRFEDWNEKVACGLAEREGIATSCPLTEKRMAILRFLRDYFKKFDAFPMITKVCKNVGHPGAVPTTSSWTPSRPGRLPAFRSQQPRFLPILDTEYKSVSASVSLS